jgi:hypothetical protein
MKNVELYEEFYYSDDESQDRKEPTGNSYGEKFMLMLPKAMLNELTRPAKDALLSLRPGVWTEIGPIIDRINFLLNSPGSRLQWKDIMRGSSILAKNAGGPNHGTEVVSFFNSLFNEVLDRTVFKDFVSNSNWDGWSM